MAPQHDWCLQTGPASAGGLTSSLECAVDESELTSSRTVISTSLASRASGEEVWSWSVKRVAGRWG